MMPAQQKRSQTWYWKHCKIVMASEVITLSQELLPLSRTGILPNCIPNTHPHHHIEEWFSLFITGDRLFSKWRSLKKTTSGENTETGACVVSIPVNTFPSHLRLSGNTIGDRAEKLQEQEDQDICNEE